MADSQFVLSQAKWLKDNPKTASIYISAVLSQDELGRLKELRRRCVDLNKDGPLDKKGRKKYVVLSGKIMYRSDEDKLLPLNGSNKRPGAMKATPCEISNKDSSASSAACDKGNANMNNKMNAPPSVVSPVTSTDLNVTASGSANSKNVIGGSQVTLSANQ